jgi:hypothetical protein
MTTNLAALRTSVDAGNQWRTIHTTIMKLASTLLPSPPLSLLETKRPATVVAVEVPVTSSPPSATTVGVEEKSLALTSTGVRPPGGVPLSSVVNVASPITSEVDVGHLTYILVNCALMPHFIQQLSLCLALIKLGANVHECIQASPKLKQYQYRLNVLQAAAIAGNGHLIESLITNGSCDINSVAKPLTKRPVGGALKGDDNDDLLLTPLVLSIQNHQFNTSLVLIRCGAQVDYVVKNATKLIAVAPESFTPVCKSIIGTFGNDRPLMIALVSLLDIDTNIPVLAPLLPLLFDAPSLSDYKWSPKDWMTLIRECVDGPAVRTIMCHAITANIPLDDNDSPCSLACWSRDPRRQATASSSRPDDASKTIYTLACIESGLVCRQAIHVSSHINMGVYTRVINLGIERCKQRVHELASYLNTNDGIIMIMGDVPLPLCTIIAEYANSVRLSTKAAPRAKASAAWSIEF